MAWRHVACGAVLFLYLSVPAAAALFDHAAYDAVLQHYVDEDGFVDYASVRVNSLTALESYFERLAEADLAGWPQPERLAFWINAYNARVMYEVAKSPDLKTIGAEGELFNRPFKIAGQTLTPNDIEHRILRGAITKDGKKGPLPGVTLSKPDPRIHFALVRGAIGSPKLRNFAYTAENIDGTLEINAAAFVHSPANLAIVDGHLQVSSLLKWYAEDFKSVGGVKDYLLSLLAADQRDDAETIKALLSGAYDKATFTFDWTVNDQKNKPEPKDDPWLHAPPGALIPPDAFSTSNPDLSK